jgi:hypothetical protein
VADCLAQALCYAPRQFRVAYGIQPLLDGGIDGRSQTVVLLEFAAPAGSPPRVTGIRQDLARFDHLFGLPAARLQVINSLARSASPWLANGEEVEDTEIVHAAAPGAAIREVLIDDKAQGSPAAASTGLAAALRRGMTQGAVISFSHSWGEHCFTTAEVAQLNSALQAASSRRVTVINSSGAVIGGKGDRNEAPLARKLVPLLREGMLLLADRAYDAAGLLAAVAATGAHFLVRGSASRKPAVLDVLPDGSYLSEIDGLTVRIIEADLDVTGADGTRIGDNYRLITTLTDWLRYPAGELIALYHERWGAT